MNAPTVSVRVAEESAPDEIEWLPRTRGSVLSHLEYLDLTDIDTSVNEIVTRSTNVRHHQEQITK